MGDETGYITCPLADEMNLLCWNSFHVLEEMGVVIPNEFPRELDVDYEETDPEDLPELIDRNPYSALIYEIFKSLTNVYGFYAAYVAELIDDDELELIDTPACNIEPRLMSLAACKLEEPPKLAKRFREFRWKVTKDYNEWLSVVKDKAFRSGIPLRAELLRLVHASDDELGEEAEAEAMGFNASRVHPDAYMNELLVGMRIIHRILPAIMKKLGIDDDFKLDRSEFWIK